MTNLGTNFYPKLVSIASELGMKPEDIVAIMVSESGLNPTAHEQKYNGGGLIGFMPDTLKNLGFKGSPEDFRKLLGEQQLDYVKKNIENNIHFNGAPFKSAAQYYVANFFPVALKLPGIKNEDPRTPFIEENPETIYDPKTGKRWSKKYSDIGYKIDPNFEKSAYKANPLFHGGTVGAITYGDMLKQVDKNKRTDIYKQALNSMKESANYVAKSENYDRPHHENSGDVGSFVRFISNIEKIIKQFVTASEKNTYLISLASSADNSLKTEYATILSTALKEYLKADSTIHIDKNNIEIQANINGNKKVISPAIKELSVSIANIFYDQTKHFSKDKIFTIVSTNLKSSYPEMNMKTLDRYARRLEFQRIIK